MKASLIYIWRHRWSRLLLAVVLLAVFALGSYFVWQSTPSSMVEQSIRDRMVNGKGNPILASSPRFLPTVVHLSADPDVKVCRYCLDVLAYYRNSPDHVPVLTARLADEDPQCRILAAHGIWRANRDLEMRKVAVSLVDHPDLRVRSVCLAMVREMVKEAPDLFDVLAKLCEDPDPWTRIPALQAMSDFPGRNAPVIRKALRDPILQVRCSAIEVVRLSKDASEFIPDLVDMQANDADPIIRNGLPYLLHRIDAERFANPLPTPENPR